VDEDVDELRGSAAVTDASSLWRGCATLLRQQLSDGVWSSSFHGITADRLDGDTLVLAVPSAVVRERVVGRYLPLIEANLAELGHHHLRVAFETRSPGADGRDVLDVPAEVIQSVAPAPSRTLFDELGHPVVPTQGQGLPEPRWAPVPAASELNTRYTFDSFVTGASNQFAHAACVRVAEQPARSYNPLFIYGEAGLGKTHLLQAIGNYVAENYKASRIRYVTSETFLSEFIDAIRSGTNDQFKRRYRDVDVLLIDDIQFLEGRKETQEEFFHTFNALHQANRQIVLTSDRPPDAIPTLEDRLRSRFSMGLMTDIQPPDLETRLAILRAKADQESTAIPEEILQYIAESINDNNIRSLEGALTRLTAYANLTEGAMTVDRVAEILADLVSETQAKPVTPAAILEHTSAYFGFPVEEIVGRSRTRPLTHARHVAMYVFREMTDLSFPNIAKEFGGRDHTTVIHAVERITTAMADKEQTFRQVMQLIQRIKNDA
jgi:chromosomal replication initiator protein